MSIACEYINTNVVVAFRFYACLFLLKWRDSLKNHYVIQVTIISVVSARDLNRRLEVRTSQI